MSIELSPGLILIVGALLVPMLKGHLRAAYMLALPIAAFALLLTFEHGAHGIVEIFGIEMVTLRVDRLSLIFGYMFLIAAVLIIIYQLHVDDTVQHVSGLIYAGSGIGAVFAGDLLTLFVFWEGTAIAAVFLIWASRTESALGSGIRYLIIQVGSGVLLLAGALLHYRATGSTAFGALDIGTTGGLLIFLAFGIKSAFPLLHNWLQDSYPEATVTGTVMLSAITTKLAIYALARGFAGTEILVAIGATMAAFPIVYAIIENNLRRVLAYGLNGQLGFMVVGIGIGTELSVSGSAAHAFCSVLYQGLLFMSMGAVLMRTGTAKGSELGGLYRTMPWTTGFCIVGAASVAAFPLFSGFVSKAIIISAALKEGYFVTWLILLFASAAVIYHSGIKVPFFAFFGRDSGLRPKEAPMNMRVAMGLTAALCIGIGVMPGQLYAILPYDISYASYTVEHIVTQLQLLLFAALAFTLLVRSGHYPAELKSINLDTDWIYRRGLYSLVHSAYVASDRAWQAATNLITRNAVAFVRRLYRHHGPEGILARTWPTGSMAFWATVLLGAYLLIYYL